MVCTLLPLAQQPKARPAPAKPEPAGGRLWPIQSVTVTGNENYSEEQILQLAGLKPGQLASQQDFEAARDRLAATGAFESIEFRFGPAPGGKAYSVTFQVVEAGPLFPVRFEELGLPDEEIWRHLRSVDPLFGPRIPATEALLKRYAGAIEELLERHGRRQAVVGRLEAEGAEPLAAVFRPAVERPPIAEVRFLNNQVVPAPALQRAISGVAVGVRYSEKRFRQLLDASVRPLYEARGRVRVAFPEIQVEPARDVKGVIVTVKVVEGDSYRLGAVRLEGGPLPAEELLRLADLKTGDLFNGEQIQAGLERIEKRLRRDGYLRARAAAERQIQDDKKAVDLVIRIEPGPQYVFGKLSIQGLDLLGEAAIRRLWTLKPGQPFNADYPDYFLLRVREEGLFDNLKKTRAVTVPHDDALTVDVTLEFH